MILRNLSKAEYVRSDAIELDVDDGTAYRPMLVDVLVSRLCWSTYEPYESSLYNPQWLGTRPIHRGIWAGDRFDIVVSGDFDDTIGGWKDVSTKARRELYGIYTARYGKAVVDSWEPRMAHVPKVIDAPFPPCILDIQRRIMEYAAEEDIMDALSLARVSKLTFAWITPVIYRAVTLEHEHKVPSFCDALQSNPDLGAKVHRLFLRRPGPQYLSTKSFEMTFEIILASLRLCVNLQLLITDIDMLYLSSEDDTNDIPMCPALRHFMGIPTYNVLTFKEQPLLRNVTHFSFQFTNEGILRFCLSTLRAPWRVTHLALFCPFEELESETYHATCIDSLLQDLPSLEVLLLIADASILDRPKTPLQGRWWLKRAQIKDERVFARCGLDVDDWEDIMRHGATLFDNVETKYKNWRESIPTLTRP